MTPAQFHRFSPVLYASSFKSNGEVASWSEGEMMNVYHSYGHTRYCVRDMKTNEVIGLLMPEDVKPWPKEEVNKGK